MKIKAILVIFILLSAISLIPVVQAETIENGAQRDILSRFRLLKNGSV